MTELLVGLRQPLAEGGLDLGAVVELRHLLDAGGKLPVKPWRETRSVAVSGEWESSSETRFDLPGPGRYGLTVLLPREADLEREYDLQEGESRQDVIDLPSSPHEWLAWQQFAGVVDQEPTARPPSAVPDADPFQHASLRALNAAVSHRDHLRAMSGAMGLPMICGAEPATDADPWAIVEDPAALRLKHFGQDWERSFREHPYQLIEPRLPEFGEALIDALRQPRELAPHIPGFPRFLAWEQCGRRDLASVPWVWWGVGPRAPGERITLFYDGSAPSPIDPDLFGRLVIGVTDRRWGALLEFAASGRLFEAAELANAAFGLEPPEAALYGKLKGPLVAALGGLVLIATTRRPGVQHWDMWLDNLDRWFPSLPDGAILNGYRLLQRGHVTQGRERLLEGVARGIPYFTAVVRMLTLGLSQLEEDKVLRRVSAVASRVDPAQPFTIVHGAAM